MNMNWSDAHNKLLRFFGININECNKKQFKKQHNFLISRRFDVISHKIVKLKVAQINCWGSIQ